MFTPSTQEAQAAAAYNALSERWQEHVRFLASQRDWDFVSLLEHPERMLELVAICHRVAA